MSLDEVHLGIDAVQWRIDSTTSQAGNVEQYKQNTHEPRSRLRFTQPYVHSRLHLPLLVYAWHYSAGPMIYTGCTITRRNHRRSLSQPRRSICRRALPSCASSWRSRRPEGSLATRTLRVCGGQRVYSGTRLAGMWGVCTAFAGRAWLRAPAYRIASASLNPSLRNFDSTEQLPSMKDS